MAELTLTVPDEIVSRVLDAFDGFYTGRPAETTKANWARQWIRHYVRKTVRVHEGRVAIEGLQSTAESAADAATAPIS